GPTWWPARSVRSAPPPSPRPSREVAGLRRSTRRPWLRGLGAGVACGGEGGGLAGGGGPGGGGGGGWGGGGGRGGGGGGWDGRAAGEALLSGNALREGSRDRQRLRDPARSGRGAGPVRPAGGADLRPAPGSRR